jgi:sterol desaturase/sphingolipid hydroxylase (fatty acid hydroxylase superfamily)
MSASLVPLYFFHHPLMVNIVKVDLVLSAILGHDGHDFPGSGDWMHYIHHIKCDCNYGSPNAPFDLLFGTVDYDDGED